MSLFEISKIQRTIGIPKMSLFEIEKVQRTKVQMSRATKQSTKELSEGPDMINSDSFRATNLFKLI